MLPVRPCSSPLTFATGLALATWQVALAAAGAPQSGLRFVDATAEAGIAFVYENGGAGERYMVETMGSGLALVDVDVDGYMDAYFAQGAPTPGASFERELANELYRGGQRGQFSRAGDAAGVSSRGYAMGVTVADYDNDGFPDIYVTNFGVNELFRNNGDGSFASVGEVAGVDDGQWGVSAAWGDFDSDGNLDLYVTNYVDFAWDNHKFCGNPRRNLRAYCHPDVYGAEADRLYFGRGDGTFLEGGQAAGIADTLDGKGLGVVLGDYDDDGDLDIYVANDSTRNFLYTNVDGRTFAEDGLLAGVGFNADGQAEAGMGTDWGDFDGDGRLDLIVTNLDLETNSLYRNDGQGAFSDVTYANGIGEASLLRVGFGANWGDFDNDGDLDLFIANGHIIDNIAEFRDNIEFAQPNHLFLNDGTGQLTERSAELGPGMALVHVSRGSAAGDYDNDGDLDLLVSNNDQRADLLRNDGGAAGGWIQLRLVGSRANRTAVGARVVLEHDGRAQLREVTAGSSYCATSDPRLQFGVGRADAARVTVRWPGGATEDLGTLESGSLYVVREGHGVVGARGRGR